LRKIKYKDKNSNTNIIINIIVLIIIIIIITADGMVNEGFSASLSRILAASTRTVIVLLVIEVCQNSKCRPRIFCGGFSGGLTPNSPLPLGYGPGAIKVFDALTNKSLAVAEMAAQCCTSF